MCPTTAIKGLRRQCFWKSMPLYIACPKRSNWQEFTGNLETVTLQMVSSTKRKQNTWSGHRRPCTTRKHKTDAKNLDALNPQRTRSYDNKHKEIRQATTVAFKIKIRFKIRSGTGKQKQQRGFWHCFETHEQNEGSSACLGWGNFNQQSVAAWVRKRQTQIWSLSKPKLLTWTETSGKSIQLTHHLFLLADLPKQTWKGASLRAHLMTGVVGYQTVAMDNVKPPLRLAALDAEMPARKRRTMRKCPVKKKNLCQLVRYQWTVFPQRFPWGLSPRMVLQPFRNRSLVPSWQTSMLWMQMCKC